MSIARPLAFAFAALLAASACSKSKTATTRPIGSADVGSRPGSTAATSSTTRGPSAAAGDAEADGRPDLAPIYFDYDDAALSPAARAQLEQVAAWLAKDRGARIVIEGHTDERGTDEYNIALGERRARTIQAYLERLGVSEAQLRAVSFGEARPARDGSSEEAWAQNRRGALVGE